MRILHVNDGIPPATLGGTGRIVREIAAGQAKRGHTVGILSAAPAGGLSETEEGVSLLRLEPKSERWAHYRCVFSGRREREVLAAIDAFRPDLVHAHTVSRQCGYRWMAHMKERGIRLVVTCHDVSSVAHGKVTARESALWWSELRRYRWTWNPLRRALIRRFLKHADRLLAVSSALQTYLEQKGIAPTTVLHNGIDLEFWKPAMDRGNARKQLGLPRDLPLFLLAGRLGHDKGSSLITATLPQNAGLLLAGEAYEAIAATFPNRAFPFPRQSPERMRSLYAACDAVLVPSRCLDCFPTVCLEAQALERPVLATSWGGAKESVADGTTGWIIDPLDEEAWKARMQWCRDHSADLPPIGKAGRKRMEEFFGLETMLEVLERVYREAEKVKFQEKPCLRSLGKTC